MRDAKKCAFDEILKYFLYQVLDSNSLEKVELDKLQGEIEQLQEKRYYAPKSNISLGNDLQAAGTFDATNDLTASSCKYTPPSIKVIDPEETPRKADWDPEKDQNCSPEERKLVEQRRKILDRLLNIVIDSVLHIANDQLDIRPYQVKLEKAFAKGLHESQRYGPYVEMCNLIFGKLADLDVAGFRERSVLDIRFQVLNDVQRTPDVGGLSEAAFQKICKLAPSESPISAVAPLPGELLRWWHFLLLQEFEVSNGIKPHGMIQGLDKHKYASTAKPSDESAGKLPQLDIPMPDAAEQLGEVVQGLTGSKRTSTAAGLGTGDCARPAKRQSLQASANGSISKALDSQDVPSQDKPPQKSVDGRVQCASYALETMSYNAGVQHVINLLFTDAVLRIWYYDRQGTIQSSGISIFEDFPRFIVLLFAFQRFTLADWGIIKGLNPEAVQAHSAEVDVSARKVIPECEFKSYGKAKEKAATETEDEPMNEDPKAENEDDPLDIVDVDLNEHLENLKNLSGKWKGEAEGGAVNLSGVLLRMNDYLSNQPHCLAGRATAVVPATGYTRGSKEMEEMVCKLYHPEVGRANEGVIMEVIYKVAEDDEKKARTDPERAKLCIKSMFDHLPKVYFYGDVKGTTTQRVRSMLNLQWKGHRVMRMIGMRKLEKLTILKEWEFVKAWLEGVICHEFLWKNYIEHGDPSLSNLMYDPVKKCGVLTDFDLSLLQWEPRVFGTDRTGTVPFMAVDILTQDYWDGWVKRHYYHELESFVWILVYVFLLYQGRTRQRNAFVDEWRTSSYQICLEQKATFWLTSKLKDAAHTVQKDFRPCWNLAADLCKAIHNQFTDNDNWRWKMIHTARTIAQQGQWTPEVISDSEEERPPMKTIVIESPTRIKQGSEALWKSVYEGLNGGLKHLGNDFVQLVKCFKYFKPSFSLSPEDAKRLREDFLDLLYVDGIRPADSFNQPSDHYEAIVMEVDSNGNRTILAIVSAQADQEDDVFT